MLTRPQVQRYAAESGLRDIMIAEKEVVLTYLLQLLSDRGILHRLSAARTATLALQRAPVTIQFCCLRRHNVHLDSTG